MAKAGNAMYNFNPRSREGSDSGCGGNLPHQDISIHAPAKGATSLCCCQAVCCAISIHAPAKGATQSRRKRAEGDLFQSTLPRRERPDAAAPILAGKNISIHAPAKGATHRRDWVRGNSKKFQSTLPRRERLSAVVIVPSVGNFNPRSREGSDGTCGARHNRIVQFQSTLPRRERQ